MSITINNANLPPINQDRVNRSFQQISSGERINSAADDPAGLAISNRLDTQLGDFSASLRNAGDGISLTQLGDGALQQVNQNFARVRELAVQSANGTLTDTDRRALQEEASQLLESTQDLLSNTNFNGVSLFANDNDTRFQVGGDAGSNITLEGRNLADEAESLGLGEININSQSGALSAIQSLDSLQNIVTERASEFGAIANRLQSTIEAIETNRVNTAEARSRIADTDLAKASSELAAERIRNEVQIAVRAQANSQSSLVLNLLS